MIGRLPDFLCIGAMRCGTTNLWKVLSRHPRVFVPDRKELHFFDNRNGAWDRGIEWYSRFFDDAPVDALCGESTPNYMFVQDAARRIQEVLPNIKMITLLRDPVERAWSHYWFNVRAGREVRSFPEAIRHEERRIASRSMKTQLWFSYVARGRYIEQLQFLEQLFERQQLLILFLEEWKQKPAKQFHRVLRFLDLQDEVDKRLLATSGAHNRGVNPRSRHLHVSMRRLSRWGRCHSLPVRGPLRALAQWVRQFNLRHGTPPLDKPTVVAVSELFEESDKALARWLGRALPWRSAGGAQHSGHPK